MTNSSTTIVQKLWNYCNVLRDDGISYGDYVEQLLFLMDVGQRERNSLQRQMCGIIIVRKIKDLTAFPYTHPFYPVYS